MPRRPALGEAQLPLSVFISRHPAISVMAMKPNPRDRTPAKKVRPGLMAALVAIVTLTLSSIGAIALAPVASGAPLTCKASMSNATPKTYTSTNVLVSTAARAGVTTTAQYKTTKTIKTTKANVLGKATVTYHISSATPDFTVVVKVVVMSSGKSASCSTKFVPQARK